MTDTFIVSEAEHGSRLDHVLSARYPVFSVSSLLQLISKGDVNVNGHGANRRDVVRDGDEVQITLDEERMRRDEPRRMGFEILYEDASMLVLNKPAELAVTPERNQDEYPLMSGLLHYLARESDYATGDLVRPMIVHRLDKNTTGALAIAKSLAAMRHLSRQFEERSVHKEYLAIVRGTPPREQEIDLPISTKGVKGGRAVIDMDKGRPAVTLVQAEEYFRGFALVRAIPRTGRMHQVRLHLKEAGYPLVCDPFYAGGRDSKRAFYLSEFKAGYRPKRGRPESPLIERQALHAHRLGFEVMPEAGGSARRVLVEAPLPNDMAVVLKMLRKYRT